jgi:hypothetical protein
MANLWFLDGLYEGAELTKISGILALLSRDDGREGIAIAANGSVGNLPLSRSWYDFLNHQIAGSYQPSRFIKAREQRGAVHDLPSFGHGKAVPSQSRRRLEDGRENAVECAEVVLGARPGRPRLRNAKLLSRVVEQTFVA